MPADRGSPCVPAERRTPCVPVGRDARAGAYPAQVMIWLPPSEGKTAPAHGPALDLAALSLPALTEAREEVARTLVAVSASPSGAEVLHLGPRSRGDLETNAHLGDAPCAPAREVFSGVLFEAAGLGRCRRGPRGPEVWIFSGLFGALRPEDPIPDHRLPMGARLPGTGALAGFWRPRLHDALEDRTRGATVVDLRSGPYRSACTGGWADVLRIDVVRSRDGRRGVVSHQAKHWRGMVCAGLLDASPDSLPPTVTVEGCVSAIRSTAPTMVAHDATGARQQVVDVEVGPTTPTREGGSVTVLTLVVD